MIVYKAYNQQELDEQYNTRFQVPDYASYLARWEHVSRLTDEELKHVPDITYGEDPLECLDIFPAEKPGAKTMVFIHGGYWHLLDKSMFHFLARGFMKLNIMTVLINYPLAPSAPIDNIVRSCRRAMEWLHKHIIHYNGNPAELYVAGHSAGGHLAAMLMTEKSMHFLKGVISLSGLFRLEPIMHSYVNDVLGMDMETATRNSPLLLKPLQYCPLLLVTGGDESKEFQSQSLELHDRWQPGHGRIQMVKIAGRNHYSILDTLAEEGSSVQILLSNLMDI